MKEFEKDVIERLTRIEERIVSYKNMVIFNRKIMVILLLAIAGMAIGK